MSIIGIYYDLIYMEIIIGIGIISMMYSKSAQLPFFT